jgi:predicted RNA-binding protein with PUA-like domain
MNYYLMKSEPDCYSIDNLKKDRVTSWSGVRNYQARNFMMEMKLGDQILFYHSSAKEIGVAGIGEIVKEAHPDHTAWNPKDEHFDATIKKGDPRWQMVDVRFVEKFPNVVTLATIKNTPALANMKVLQKGSRLSVTPVTKKEFETILKLAK